MTGAAEHTTAAPTGAGVDFPYPVMVEIKGIAPVATFARLADALTAVRSALAALPLDVDHGTYLAEMFAPQALERIARQLTEIGAVRVIVFVGMEAHPIYLRPADDRRRVR